MGQSFDQLTRWLGAKLERRVVPKVALSYEELTRGLRDGSVDVAWVPPIVHAHLQRDAAVTTLLGSQRAQSSVCVLVCRQSSAIMSLEDVRTTRAAWVDPWSASGYVMPRLFLLEHGIDPRTSFLEERFFGSHDAAVRAVAGEVYDITATFARLDASGKVVAAGWRSVPEGDSLFRVFSILGPIPADVIAARSALSGDERGAITNALVQAIADPTAGELARRTFEIEAFCKPSDDPTSKELLQALERAGSLFSA